jgi:hypothetical protein
MANIPIDIPLPDAIVQRLTPPTCEDISLPQPQKLNLCLPFGGSFQGIVDVTKAIPDDCSLTFSILLQLPPLMASLGCFIKILGLLKPLVDIIGGLTSPTDPSKVGAMTSAIPDFVKAGVDVVSCFTSMVTGIPKFIRDMLHMIAKLIKCIAGTIKSIAELMTNLGISIKTAEATGNKALQRQLQCASDNAKAQAQAALGSMDMIAAVLALAEPLLALAGVSLSIPAIGGAEDAQALEDAANTMLSIGTSIDQIASALDALGSC